MLCNSKTWGDSGVTPRLRTSARESTAFRGERASVIAARVSRSGTSANAVVYPWYSVVAPDTCGPHRYDCCSTSLDSKPNAATPMATVTTTCRFISAVENMPQIRLLPLGGWPSFTTALGQAALYIAQNSTQIDFILEESSKYPLDGLCRANQLVWCLALPRNTIFS